MEKALDFEKLVSMHFKTKGWNAHVAKPCTEGYDIFMTKEDQRAVVQVKNHKNRIGISAIEKFTQFLRKHSKDFDRGFFVSSSGFTDSARAYANNLEPQNVALGVYDKHKETMLWRTVSETMKRKYVGVWTCKGGTGKTTVSAHLAGAFALCGYDVLLLDLDKQKNLSRLLGNGVVIKHKVGDEEEAARITVVSFADWAEHEHEEKIIICDCAPDPDSNPVEIVRKFDYCIIPIMLTPLGISKNCSIVNQTCAAIGKHNGHAKTFIVINNLVGKGGQVGEKLNYTLKRFLIDGLNFIGNCHYIDPYKNFAIHHSQALMNWGFETVTGDGPPQLGFTKNGTTQSKKEFLCLAEYIQMYTDLNEMN